MAPSPPPPGPTPIFDARCAILATANFTLPSTGNISACYLAPLTPTQKFDPHWLILIAIGSIIVILLLFLLSCCQLRRTRRELITQLRNTPSYELHQVVEKMYAYYHHREDEQEFKTGPGGRIQKVTSKVKEGKRTVVIVEDLTRQPIAEFVRVRSRSRSRERDVSRGGFMLPLPPPRWQDQIPRLPLAADRTMWPPRPPTPEEVVPPAPVAVPAQPAIRFDTPAIACGNGCSAPTYEPPPAYNRWMR